ncbi:hypothetical protein AYI68_g2908 [Smittium mucronatum]|uniref:Hexosyltransferase n=1 Tax=Smittium mucronatum TaxID=133383 RepID=A0A1R0H1E0_9FUNG|nr:hypothetical protein AYI68_g2908 [Smittium mucronatum]
MGKEIIDTLIIEGTRKVKDEVLGQIYFYDYETRRNFIKLPEKFYVPGRIIDLYYQYQIIVPISKRESITFLKNFYSDLNVKVYCDVDDYRDGCDIRSDKSYKYHQLSYKTFDMFNYVCKNFEDFKIYAKMDFDAYIDKNYVYGVLKFISDNSERMIYYGNPILRNGKVFNGGNFYAISGSLFRDYCSCKIHPPKKPNEDEWFGEVLNNCFYSKNYINETLIYMKNDMTKILHKHYTDDGVDIKLGRWVKKE